MHTPLHRVNTGSWLYTRMYLLLEKHRLRVHELFKKFAFKILSHSARIVRCFLLEYGDSKCRISSRICTPITNKDTDAQETNMNAEREKQYGFKCSLLFLSSWRLLLS
jgi:hypothetical protein